MYKKQITHKDVLKFIKKRREDILKPINRPKDEEKRQTPK